MNEIGEPAGASLPFVPLCAIGASAGGVTALQSFFRQVPTDLGLAYVVILHLSPDQPSLLSEILSACTRMPVTQVHGKETLKANCVLVIPPDRRLAIEGDSVSAQPFEELGGQRASIDLFFRSTAAARGDGVAIILSGAGQDGAMGVRAIKEAGGVVMVQDPAEAEFSSMPKSAIATGAVDIIAPVARLVERLREIAHSKEAVRSLDAEGSAQDLRRIVAFLRSRTGHDFSGYKRATIMRRVMRRMQVCRATTLPSYLELLHTSPAEVKGLFDDLLISVTQFFRDGRAFEVLQQRAIRQLFDDTQARSEEPLRAWVVGCATGEEAYSVAILLLEETARRQMSVPIQIFATDLDERALSIAREGRYPHSIATDVTQERLARFFIDEGTYYRVSKEVRQVVLFATHSVLRDPPFIRLDLISCRNLLIYLERSLQQQLIALFHYSLKDHRYLFMGSAEAVDLNSGQFVSLDRDARIFTSRPPVADRIPLLPQFPGSDRMVRPPLSVPAHDHPALPVSLHLTALERTSPPSVLVDGAQNIVHLSPNAGRFIQHSGGPVSNLLPAVVRPELRLDLKLALDRALTQGTGTLTYPSVVAFEKEQRSIAMQVQAVGRDERSPAQAVVFFLDAGPIPAHDRDDEPERPAEARRLHAELKATQEALAASRSGHDATIQDLRAANEELQSTNEEYRSTAEELETSREELQSINEELHTVNAELKGKLDVLSAAHSDLQNLTVATEIGTLFLDGELHIKMFTPPIAELFNITRQDIGRPVTHFTHLLDYSNLATDARLVLAKLVPLEREVRSLADRWYVVRLRPYYTMENRIEGVVLTFVDISRRLKTEADLRRSEQEFRALVKASSQVLYRISPQWDEMRELVGGGFLANTERPNTSWLEQYIPHEDQETVRRVIGKALESRGTFDLEHRVIRADGTIGWTHSRAIPLTDDKGSVVEWLGAASDVTSSRRAEEARRESEERLRVLLENMPQLVWRAGKSGRWTWSSPQWHHTTGLSAAESLDYGWLQAVHLDDRDALLRAWHSASGSSLFQVECRVRRVGSNEYRWFSGRATPLLDVDGRVLEWLGTFTDVDDLRTLQEHQGILMSELQHRVRNLFAVIHALVVRTAERSESVQDFVFHFEGRLGSLARTQVLLTRQPGQEVRLDAMVHEELAAQAPESHWIQITSPVVMLAPKAAEVLSLAVHELVTNAVKYGSLSASPGTLEISWRLEQRQQVSWLVFVWTESGLSLPPDQARRRGYGSELIEERVPYELGGEGVFEFNEQGLRCIISFPLRQGRSILQADVT